MLLLAALSVVSIYFYSQLATLNDRVVQDESIISWLQTHINDQQLVINRFNESVTNSDVQHKVEDLEKSLQLTQGQMLSQLDDTTKNIQKLLDETVEKLDTTVQAAQAEIQNEVNIVKGDVESYVRTTQDQFSMENSFMVYQLAGTFTLLASLISMWHMTGHVRRFKRPFVQRKILAILWMSPIYGITSWLSLVFPKYEGYLSIVKDFYEAYVIYQFLSFLISVLGRGDRDKVVDLLSKHADHLEPPMRLFGWCRGKYPFGSPRALADAVLMQCQAFTMQFVFFKPMTAVGTFTCNKLDYFGQGTSSSDYRSPQFWFTIIQNVSIFIAFSGLLKFYHAVQEDLSWCRPFPKFLCIKGIVFMTFWQGLVISFLADSTLIAKGNGDKAEDPDIWGRQAQNFLICLEMLLFSIAHFYCFPTEEWQDGYRLAVEKKMSAGDNLAFGDFVADLKLIVSGNTSNAKKKNKKKKDSDEKIVQDPPTSSTPLVDQGVDKDSDAKKNDEEQGLLSETPGNVSDTGLSTGSQHNNSSTEFDTTQGEEESDIETSNQSIDMDHLSSSIKSSVQDAFLNPDAEVREAANRLLPLMEKIGEENEFENVQDTDDSHQLNGEASAEDPFAESNGEKTPTSPYTEEFPTSSYNEEFEGTSQPVGGNTYGAFAHDNAEEKTEPTSPWNEEFEGTSQPVGGNTYGAFAHNNAEENAESNDMENANDEAAPNETTSLLGGSVSDKSDVQLRPSIFTTHL
jgi:hypothetical protein